MKKIIAGLFLAICSLAANASEIKFSDNPVWTTVLETAKKEHKMIFLDAYATWCGPCKMMDSETYVDSAVADFYNKNFINVKYDMEKGEGLLLADRYYVNAYPNLVFISPEGALLHKSVGFLPAGEFLELGKLAINPATQYYSIKKQALKLSTKDFLAFAKQAHKLQDEDFDLIGSDYLAAKSDILGDQYLIELVMEYIGTLPKEENLAYLKQNKSLALRIGKYTGEDFEQRLLDLSMQYALSEQVQLAGEVDFELVKKILDKYVPEQAYAALNFYKIQLNLHDNQVDDPLKALYELFENHQKVDYEQLCGFVMNISPAIFEAGKLDDVFSQFDKIRLSKDEQNLSYLNNFTKAVCYLKTGQEAKFKEKANEVLAHPNTPEELKEKLRLALQNRTENTK
jgi:thiol-disulfide isomerase/thioredoxin